jgi:hypothetical protein
MKTFHGTAHNGLGRRPVSRLQGGRSRVLRAPLLAGIGIVVVMVAFQIAMASTFHVGFGDFGSFYTAARIAATGRLADFHNEALQASVEAPYIPAGWHAIYCVRLQAWAVALLPFGLLPFKASFVAWLAVQALILIAGWIWAARRFGIDAAVLASMFLPALLGIVFGQDPAFWFGFVLLSWILFERGKPFGAGMSLGLCIVKPQLIFLVPIAMLIQRRWRMLAGFLSGCVVVVGGSMLLGGWNTLPRYAAFLGRVSTAGALGVRHEREMGVSAILISAGLPLVLRFALMAAAGLALFVASRRSGWETGLAAAMLASFLIAPHTECYDATALMVAAWLMVFLGKTRLARTLAAFFFTPIPWLLQLLDQPWTGVPALLLMCLLSAIAWGQLRAANPAPRLEFTPDPII